MHKLTKSDASGDLTDWSLMTGLDLPSYVDSFTLKVGSRVTIEASPKIYQGHNVDGPKTLREAADRIVNFIFGIVLRLESWPPASLWFVARLDITYSYDFGSRPLLECWFDSVVGLNRGQRRSSVVCSVEDDPISVRAAPSGRTLYLGLGSRLKVGKIYSKAGDLVAHPPLCIRGNIEFLDALVEEFQPIGRFECQIRAPWLSIQSTRIGLLPSVYVHDEHFAVNAALFMQRSGFPVFPSSRSKHPIFYFTVGYLSTFLDIDSVWDSEFQHLFAREVAMADDTLIKELLLLAKTPGQARAAFQFYNSVRQSGFSAARHSVGKTQFYAHRKLLASAGVSAAMLQDGAPLVRLAPSAVNVRAFTPRRDRLEVVEQVHSHFLPSNVERLHAEVFRRSA